MGKVSAQKPWSCKGASLNRSCDAACDLQRSQLTAAAKAFKGQLARVGDSTGVAGHTLFEIGFRRARSENSAATALLFRRALLYA